MTSVLTKFCGGLSALFSMWVTTQVCAGCSGANARTQNGGSGAAEAGTNSNGGHCGTADDCSSAGSAGAPLDHGGSGGSSDAIEGAGTAETSDAVGGASGDTALSGDSGASGDSSAHFVPAAHQPYPLVPFNGGPVLENIELVPVYFGDDPLHDDLERFNAWLVASHYWTQVGAEYGVYAGSHEPFVRFEEPPPSPISDLQVASWIDARIADKSLPKPSPNTVFVLYFPAQTKVTFQTSASCTGFAGLHESASIDNPIFTGSVPFAIVPRCSFEPGDELMIATNVASHELFEAATDPLSVTSPAWQLHGNEGEPLEAWQMLGGLELSDLCESQYYDVVDGFTVTDLWSNSAARAGNNPCQPSDPKHPFFSVTAEATIYHAQPGATLTIHAGAWSNQPAPDWAIGINWGYIPSSNFDGHATLSRTTVNNGDDVTATVTIPADPSFVGGRSVYRFTIDSIDPINPNFFHPWPFLVVVP